MAVHPIRSFLATAVFALGTLVLASAPAWSAVAVGAPAPAFSGKAADGSTETLAEHKGHFVVLEWLNHGCPYVKKHYESENMQRLQKEYTGKGVVWISIISSAPGKQGHSSGEQAVADAKRMGAAPSTIILDEDGVIGKLYGATTTPHMFVIDPAGVLVYMGAIDDQPSFDASDMDSANNYVRLALDRAMAGAAVETQSTKPYGCSVKY